MGYGHQMHAGQGSDRWPGSVFGLHDNGRAACRRLIGVKQRCTIAFSLKAIEQLFYAISTRFGRPVGKVSPRLTFRRPPDGELIDPLKTRFIVQHIQILTIVNTRIIRGPGFAPCGSTLTRDALNACHRIKPRKRHQRRLSVHPAGCGVVNGGFRRLVLFLSIRPYRADNMIENKQTYRLVLKLLAILPGSIGVLGEHKPWARVICAMSPYDDGHFGIDGPE